MEESDQIIKEELIKVFKKSEGRLKSALEAMYSDDPRLDKVKVVVGDINWYVYGLVCEVLGLDNRRKEND